MLVGLEARKEHTRHFERREELLGSGPTRTKQQLLGTGLYKGNKNRTFSIGRRVPMVYVPVHLVWEQGQPGHRPKTLDCYPIEGKDISREKGGLKEPS